jgi:hypothetical protein
MTKIIGYMDDDVLELAKQYELYFDNQQSGGLMSDVFMQHGQFGGFWGEQALKRFYMRLPESFRSGVRNLRDTALSTLGSFAKDVSSGEDWRDAGKKRLGEAGTALVGKLGSKIARMMTGRGRRRRRTTVANKRPRRTGGRYSVSSSSRAKGRATKRRGAAAKRKTTTVKRRRRKTTKRRRTCPARRVTRRRRRSPQQQQQQSGGGGGDYWL